MSDNEWHEVIRKKSNSVFQRLKFPSGVNNRYFSKEDQTQKISKSVFVTNFPDHFSARDLWNVCVAYGKVVDVFIPFKRSKVCKKFAFVRFIRVDNLDRLIENLSTIWIGRFRLHANVVRLHMEPKSTYFQPKDNDPQPNKTFVASNKNMGTENRSFASVLNARRGNPSKATESSPSIVLDVDCLTERDYSCSLMGKIKDISALSNLYLILSNEGFENVKLTHLGGLWVLLDMDSIETKEKEDNSQSRDESVGDDLENSNDNLMNDFEMDNEKETDHVSESSCMKENDLVYKHVSKSPEHPIKSADPFGFYNILEKNEDKVSPDVGNVNVEEVNSVKEPQSKEDLYETNEGVASDFSKLNGFSSIKSGGSLLDVMDELIKVGHAMAYNIDGFSDSFVAIRDTWIPSATKILIISIYAPHDLNEKRMLWEFLGHLIDTWDGECVLLGDFNEVRSINERYGTEFNTHGANAFNNFIFMAGLVDLPLEGHSYTWSHKFASKMSKLDRKLKFVGQSKEMKTRNTFMELLIKKILTGYPWGVSRRLVLESQFPTVLSLDQLADLESDVSYKEIKKVVWDCGINKSPGPDGFTFEFFRWCNSSFIALIPKTQEAKVVKDFRPISLIGSVYKIIAKILANHLSLVISSLISDVQSAFVSNRQILDGCGDKRFSESEEGDNEWHEVTRKKSNSVFQRLKFPSGVNNRYFLKEDQTQKISKSVFVTNFPDHFSARDLWNVCVAYGKVVDVFIPFKRSKACKKFAFVRFIRVDNLDRLIENLSTIWIGRFRLHANVVRFHMEPKSTYFQPKDNDPQPNKTFVASDKNMGTENRSFASVLNARRGNPSKATESSPSIVLDVDCLTERDYSCSLMGKIKDISALPNLYLILSNEGFENVKLNHLGGLWVLLDIDSIETKEKVFKHVGVGLWFNGLQFSIDLFACDERIIWISIEGLPTKAMTHNTFAKIVSSWGELTNVEDSESMTLSYKRLCVKVKSFVTINDIIKVIVKGNISWIRVSPDVGNVNVEEVNSVKEPQSKEDLYETNEGVASDFSKLNGVSSIKSGGSLLDVMDELIKVGHAMGYNIDGCLGQKAKKGWIQELNSKHRVRFVALQEKKMESIDLFSIKKKLQALKTSIKQWFQDEKLCSNTTKTAIHNRLSELVKPIDLGRCNEELVSERTKLLKELHELNSKVSLDLSQKAKIFEGDWFVDPSNVKKEFLNHFSNRFVDPNSPRLVLESQFPTVLSLDQLADLESDVSYKEIKRVVWDYGINKSSGPDGFTFEFFRCDVQSAFVSNCQILDDPFILNELMPWCKHKKYKAMIFKVDFEKAFYSMRWDYLDDVLNKFGFEVKWRGWIHGCLNSAMGSILINGSLTTKFKFYKGLKQGDPLSPFLFLMIMESLHFSFKNVVHAGLYKGIHTDYSLILSHLFYADDVVFVGKWDKKNVATTAMYGMRGALDSSHSLLAHVPLKHIYPRLITLELEKNISIAVKMRDASLVYSFRRVHRGGIGEDQVTRLRNNLSHVLLSQSIDRWVWKIESSGDFSMKSARSFIDDSLLAKADVPARWVKAVPIKINLWSESLFG
uniref:RRM domain-containing protein n=1 Tax=Tanacetum cinerariifolium TaxID=118510 RepID=A0A6L2JRM0_TANCI|nr:hypothetical protein [Tanacetum cinerariifolium]